MKKLLLATAALLGASTAAQADVIPVLDTISPAGPTYEYSYSGTLSGDTGLIPGSTLVIFDFAGYVPGSISAGIYAADLLAFTELTSALPPTLGEDDDPTIANLVFQWKGAPFNAFGGPFPDVDFAGLSARSIYGSAKLDAFAALTITNNGLATGRFAYNSGFVGVPEAIAIPEPSTWALMIGGFGLAGGVLRRRKACSAI